MDTERNPTGKDRSADASRGPDAPPPRAESANGAPRDSVEGARSRAATHASRPASDAAVDPAATPKRDETPREPA